MSKKHISVILLVIGVILICLSVVLAIISTGNKNIIGGADFHTFVFVFFRENKGFYSALAFCGIILLIASAVVGLRKTK